MTSKRLGVRDAEHKKGRSSVATACAGVGWHWPELMIRARRKRFQLRLRLALFSGSAVLRFSAAF